MKLNEEKKVMRHKIISITVIVYLFVGVVTAVFAHEVTVLKSSPANGEVLTKSPPEVAAWFNEELVSSESSLIVINTQGVQVDNGDGGVDLKDPDHASMRVTLPPLPDGSYTVQWHATLLDGDDTEGAFAFAIGEGQSVVGTTPSAVDKSNFSTSSVIIVILSGAISLLIIGFVVRRYRSSNLKME